VAPFRFRWCSVNRAIFFSFTQARIRLPHPVLKDSILIG
jgi:hypothetical protein